MAPPPKKIQTRIETFFSSTPILTFPEVQSPTVSTPSTGMTSSISSIDFEPFPDLEDIEAIDERESVMNRYFDRYTHENMARYCNFGCPCRECKLSVIDILQLKKHLTIVQCIEQMVDHYHENHPEIQIDKDGEEHRTPETEDTCWSFCLRSFIEKVKIENHNGTVPMEVLKETLYTCPKCKKMILKSPKHSGQIFLQIMRHYQQEWGRKEGLRRFDDCLLELIELFEKWNRD